jgi:hypothetical protein
MIKGISILALSYGEYLSHVFIHCFYTVFVFSNLPPYFITIKEWRQILVCGNEALVKTMTSMVSAGNAVSLYIQ